MESNPVQSCQVKWVKKQFSSSIYSTSSPRLHALMAAWVAFSLSWPFSNAHSASPDCIKTSWHFGSLSFNASSRHTYQRYFPWVYSLVAIVVVDCWLASKSRAQVRITTFSNSVLQQKTTAFKDAPMPEHPAKIKYRLSALYSFWATRLVRYYHYWFR